MILNRYILTALGLNLKFFKHVIKSDSQPLKGSTAPIVDSGIYRFKNINTGKVTSVELFIKAYTE